MLGGAEGVRGGWGWRWGAAARGGLARGALTLALAIAVCCSAAAVWAVPARGALPTGYSVDVDQSGVSTSGSLGGSGSLSGSGTANVNYGYARECAPSSDGGPFSSGHYPPETCAQAGRSYSSSGSPEQPSGFWFSGNQNCVNAGRPFSGSEFVWHVELPESGYWHVDAYVPNWTSYGWGNRYVSQSDEGQIENNPITQQSYHGQWVSLFGSHEYTAGREYTVNLTPADGADSNCHYQMADQMKWVYDGPLVQSQGFGTSPVTCPTAAAAEAGSRHRVLTGAGDRRLSMSGRMRPSRRGREGHRSQHRRRERVFRLGNDEVAIPPGRTLAAAYYHFEVPASRPLRKAPGVHLGPVVVDSRQRRVFLDLSSRSGCSTVLTGTFASKAIKVFAGGKAFRLDLLARLTNLATGQAAGTFSFHLRHKLRHRHNHRRRAGRSSSSSSSSSERGGGEAPGKGLSFSLSAALNVYTGVVDAAGGSGEIAKVTASLPAVERGEGGGSGEADPRRPIGSTYKGSTTDDLPISIELTDDKSAIKGADIGIPGYPCSSSSVSITSYEGPVKVAGPIMPDDEFDAYGEEESLYAGTDIVGGYATTAMIGHFEPVRTVNGVTLQVVEGTYEQNVYGTVGIAAGSFCAHGAGFTASIAVTGG